ncbi:hypothetical protein [Catellatospora sp. NPDC049609]
MNAEYHHGIAPALPEAACGSVPPRFAWTLAYVDEFDLEKVIQIGQRP